MAHFEKCKYAESCGYEFCPCEECIDFEAKVMTNADRIRAMSDEELAWFLAERYANEAVLRARDLGHEPTATEIKALTERLHHIWLRWLLQPVEVE